MTLPKRYKFLYDKNLSDLSNLSLSVWKEDSQNSIRRALKELVNPEEYDPEDYREILKSLYSVAKNTHIDPLKPNEFDTEMTQKGPYFVQMKRGGITITSW
jgi:hypothetical protein